MFCPYYVCFITRQDPSKSKQPVPFSGSSAKCVFGELEVHDLIGRLKQVSVLSYSYNARETGKCFYLIGRLKQVSVFSYSYSARMLHTT